MTDREDITMNGTTTHETWRTEIRNGRDAYRAAIRYVVNELRATDFSDTDEADETLGDVYSILESVVSTERFDTGTMTHEGHDAVFVLR